MYLKQFETNNIFKAQTQTKDWLLGWSVMWLHICCNLHCLPVVFPQTTALFISNVIWPCFPIGKNRYILTYLCFSHLRTQQRRQQQELLKQQQQVALQQAQLSHAKLSGWGNAAKQPVITKSLLEIQREEAQQMKQRKEQPQHQHPIATQQTRPQTKTVWNSLKQNKNVQLYNTSIINNEVLILVSVCCCCYFIFGALLMFQSSFLYLMQCFKIEYIAKT